MFQNIELTALNTFAITAREGAPRPENGVMVPQLSDAQLRPGSPSLQQIPGLATQLVEYKKEGARVYCYKDYLGPFRRA